MFNRLLNRTPLMVQKKKVEEVPDGGGEEPGESFSGAYDTFESDILYAYEPARRVLASYTGNLIRLRRASDNAQEDFGYDSEGILDTAAIISWLGGSGARVKTIYDQKGGVDLVSPGDANDPTFTISGINSLPTVAFTDGWYLQTAVSIPADTGLFYVGQTNDSFGSYYVRSVGGGGASTYFGNVYGSSRWEFGFYNGQNIIACGVAVNSNVNLFELYLRSADNDSMYINGIHRRTANGGVNGWPSGIYYGHVSSFAGTSSSLLFVNDISGTSRTDLEAAVNSYWNIY